jgi:hypothetical protein
VELTRRDALAALAAAGVGSAAGCAAFDAPASETAPGAETDSGTVDDDAEDSDPIGSGALRTATAVAVAVYPSAVEDVGAFVERYVEGRARTDDDHARGVAAAVETLDDYARTIHGEPYAELGEQTRRETLEDMSVDTADPDPDGREPERVRYYLVNELLYALYASPTGASLAGLENPPGHPGGIESYRTGPQA